LITHERIFTTYHKALELRPWIEKLIHKARTLDPNNAHRFSKSVLFTNASMKKLHTEIAPRFEERNLRAGFTKIEDIGPRKNDRAKMAMIEIMYNPLQLYEE
jgi:large subunit ribosomal protein L17